MSKVFFNGEIVEHSAAGLPVDDSGYLYGMGLFETMRAVGGKVFAVDDHLDRLSKSAEKLNINCSYDKPYLKDAIDKVIKANGLSDARLRLTLTNSPERDGEVMSNVLISAAELEGYPKEHYDKGVRVVLTECRQNPTDPTCGHKVTSYAARIMELGEAHRKMAAEALWFTADNRLAEGCISNVFLVKGGVLCTPRLDTPVLAGVARKHVLELAQKLSIKAEEKDITIQQLLDAEEVFLTNVIMLVLPVVAVEAHTVGAGRPGEVTVKLLNAFNELLRKI